jgi:hypothetical protein
MKKSFRCSNRPLYSAAVQAIPFFDERPGDSFDAHFTDEWNFIECLRHVGGKMGTDPIVYKSMDAIPNPARTGIQKQLKKLKLDSL